MLFLNFSGILCSVCVIYCCAIFCTFFLCCPMLSSGCSGKWYNRVISWGAGVGLGFGGGFRWKGKG